MTAGPMRCMSRPFRSLARTHKLSSRQAITPAIATARISVRPFAKVQQPEGTEKGEWFSASHPTPLPAEHKAEGGKPPDERTLKLGKTIRILHERLPTLLASPLPQEILSPQITLRLFPSTHPHLPNVSGRIAYTAALWTAPVAWGRVPVVGNVRLDVMSERMARNGDGGGPANYRHEKLIVKWKTCGKTRGKGVGALYRGISAGEQVDKITEFLGGDARDDEEFQGLFIFEFDEEGRVVTHTIEHAEEGNSWDKMARVISVTDWLLGRAWGKREPTGLALGYCRNEGGRIHGIDGRR
ncbi:uncharacterized protein K452DRAFT_263760 [Aplosporella prunicola CBS 121167]|uniref:Uncharacterized protein n=1 Tax=Aplosporella prunicola CBS 121167 TaxID=1176127 RepID=A0A6A6BQ79_9PEZI|nr:uncharacterized protein K452DRAFT_263760 [Aplosporella prunicola CBS 121167]KAF2146150.1 hypothetical protein K452DRAFT_263760 [Aplosporella prunicola CBS 121167]